LVALQTIGERRISLACYPVKNRHEQSRLDYLEEQFRLAQQKRFGASSESHPGQGELFNEAEAELEQPEPEKEEPTTSPRKKPKRKPLPKDLPHEVVVHDIPEEDKVCTCCNDALHKIGEDKSEKLEFNPAQVKVIEHISAKYACRACEKNGTQNTIKQAPVPASTIPKGYATPQLVKPDYYQQIPIWFTSLPSGIDAQTIRH
jgi:transposase